MAFISSSSRFRRTNLLKTRLGKDTYGLINGFDEIKFIKENNYQEYTVPNSEEGRPDLISVRFYGDPQKEWVIVLANHPKNPLNWPKTGDIIKVPYPSFVRSQL